MRSLGQTEEGLSERRRAKGKFAPPPSVPWTEMDLYPGRHFELADLWSGIDDAKKEPSFRKAAQACMDPEEDPATHPAFEIAGAMAERDQVEAIASFFGIRLQNAEGDWEKIVEPFLDALQEKLNRMLPTRFPGRLEFGWAEDDSFGLFYFECAGAR